MRLFSNIKLVALQSIVLISLAHEARADLILQAQSVSTTAFTAAGDISHIIDQSGLSAGYTSLVSDFDTYIASSPTHDSSLTATTWEGGPKGDIDFNLGGTFNVEKFALWQRASGTHYNAKDFELLADDNAAFSSPVSLGTFTASNSNGTFNAALADVFTFAPVEASFVRLRILDSYGNYPIIGEAAFGVSPATAPVPEPSSLILLGSLVLFGGALYRRRAWRS